MYAEEYLVDGIKKLEDENDFLKRQNEIKTTSLLKERTDALNDHTMLLFMWDEVIDRYDSDTHMLTIGNKSVEVLPRLQEIFHLWQSFKDNPEGGGV